VEHPCRAPCAAIPERSGVSVSTADGRRGLRIHRPPTDRALRL